MINVLDTRGLVAETQTLEVFDNFSSYILLKFPVLHEISYTVPVHVCLASQGFGGGNARATPYFEITLEDDDGQHGLTPYCSQEGLRFLPRLL